MLCLLEYFDEKFAILLYRLLVNKLLAIPYMHLVPQGFSHLLLRHLLLLQQLILMLLKLMLSLRASYIDVSHFPFLKDKHGLVLGLFDKLIEQMSLVGWCRFLNAQLYLLIQYFIL